MQSNTHSFRVQLGSDAHIGNGHEQQDDMCVIRKPDIDCIIMAVADGHGSYTGKTAANVCTNGLREFVDANLELLKTDVPLFLDSCYEYLHNEVHKAFVKQYLREYKDVMVDSDRRILYRSLSSHPYSHVNGGAMLTVAVLIQGQLYISNVGDCKAILCTADKAQILTHDHSPENPNEYKRVREFRASPENPNHAELQFVYDDHSIQHKYRCEPIYEIEEDGNVKMRTDVNFYHKSVNGERGTYVTMPEEHSYTDALASTRAIGNFNMNCMGVTWKPETHMVDLSSTDEITCLAIASDGIWDNLTNETMRKFTIHAPCLKIVEEDQVQGVTRVAKSIVNRVSQVAQKNFPNHADNMTCALMYLMPTIETSE